MVIYFVYWPPKRGKKKKKPSFGALVACIKFEKQINFSVVIILDLNEGCTLGIRPGFTLLLIFDCPNVNTYDVSLFWSKSTILFRLCVHVRWGGFCCIVLVGFVIFCNIGFDSSNLHPLR